MPLCLQYWRAFPFRLQKYKNNDLKVHLFSSLQEINLSLKREDLQKDL